MPEAGGGEPGGVLPRCVVAVVVRGSGGPLGGELVLELFDPRRIPLELGFDGSSLRRQVGGRGRPVGDRLGEPLLLPRELLRFHAHPVREVAVTLGDGRGELEAVHGVRDRFRRQQGEGLRVAARDEQGRGTLFELALDEAQVGPQRVDPGLGGRGGVFGPCERGLGLLPALVGEVELGPCALELLLGRPQLALGVGARGHRDGCPHEGACDEDAGKDSGPDRRLLVSRLAIRGRTPPEATSPGNRTTVRLCVALHGRDQDVGDLGSRELLRWPFAVAQHLTDLGARQRDARLLAVGTGLR